MQTEGNRARFTRAWARLTRVNVRQPQNHASSFIQWRERDSSWQVDNNSDTTAAGALATVQSTAEQFRV